MSRDNDFNELTGRPPACVSAPLLWSLLPLIAGILCARSGVTPWLAPSCLLPALWAWRKGSSGGVIALCSFSAGLIHLGLSVELPHPLWQELPPREVTVIMEVMETFNARRPDRASGIGRILESNIPHDTVSGKRTSYYLECESSPAPGSTILCQAVMHHLPFVEELDGFQLYLKKRDIHLTLNRGDILAEITPPPWMEQLRQAALAACRTILRSGTSDPEAPGNVLASMLLGDRSLLTEERVQRYRRTGTYHLFAVSGLHVGSAAACLHWLCGLARLSPKTRLLPVLLGTWSYVWLTGGSPSAIRAGIMISCLGLARQLLRQPHLFPALVLSAWMVLLWQPAQLFDLGFQLSYCVVGAIILIGLPVVAEFRNRLERRTPQNSREHPVRHLVTNGLSRTAELACISLGAGLGSMPLIIQHFHLFTPVGVMLGVILNPLASLCVMAGCISMLASPLFGIAMAGLLAKITWPAIRLMEFLLDASLQIPGAVSERSWIWPPAGILVTLSVLALAWFLQHLRQGGRRLHTAFLLLPHAAIAASLIFTTLNA